VNCHAELLNRAHHHSLCGMQLTTVDQTTAVVGKEPLETLHTFRTGAGLGWAEASGGLHVHVRECRSLHLSVLPWKCLAR
jgi:hypothetical protein